MSGTSVRGPMFRSMLRSTLSGSLRFVEQRVIRPMAATAIITIDVEPMADFTHPRITFLVGSSLERAERFEVDRERSERYLVSHSPRGWLRRAKEVDAGSPGGRAEVEPV